MERMQQPNEQEPVREPVREPGREQTPRGGLRIEALEERMAPSAVWTD